MFEKKSEEEVEKMSPQEFEKYSNELAQSGIKAEELETPPEPAPKEEEVKEEKEVIKEEPKPKEKSEEEEESEDDEEEEKNKKPEDGKPSPAMLLEKYNKAKKKWEDKMAEKENLLSEATKQLTELNSQLDEIKNNKADMSDKDFEDYIEKTGADPEAIQSLIKIISKKAGIDPQTRKEIEDLKADRQKMAESSAYEEDFNNNISKLIRKEDPNISQENLEKSKKKLKDLAYSDKYFKYDLKDVYLLNKSEFAFKSEKKKTFESSRPSGADANQTPDYSEITDADIEKMSPAEFEKYSEAMAKAQGNERFKISGR